MRKSHRVWLAANGSGPWPCAFCGTPVPRLGDPRSEGPTAGIIHHDDRNHGNNAIGNLRAMHGGCHVTHHHLIRVPSSSRIADLLRTRIMAGEFGRRLPAQVALSEQMGVAVTTMQRALNVLKDEGLIYGVKCRGTFVKGKG